MRLSQLEHDPAHPNQQRHLSVKLPEEHYKILKQYKTYI